MRNKAEGPEGPVCSKRHVSKLTIYLLISIQSVYYCLSLFPISRLRLSLSLISGSAHTDGKVSLFSLKCSITAVT